MAPTTATKTDSRLAARLAALASVGASVIHFAVVPNHWREWMLAGLFFAAIASSQLIWARVVLTRTTAPVLAAGILLNVGAIALWALSRTAGSPFGPNAGQPELVQAADLCALLLQIYVVMGAGWVLYRGLQGEHVSTFVSAVILLGATGVVALASTIGVASGIRHGHHAPASADADHHGTANEDAPGDHHGTGAEPAEESHPGTEIEPVDSPDVGHPESVIPPAVIEPAEELTAPAPPAAPPPSTIPSQESHSVHDHGG